MVLSSVLLICFCAAVVRQPHCHSHQPKPNQINQATTTIHEQRLIAPRALELSAMEELVILEHLEAFRRNGFQFQVDESAGPMQRLKVITRMVWVEEARTRVHLVTATNNPAQTPTPTRTNSSSPFPTPRACSSAQRTSTSWPPSSGTRTSTSPIPPATPTK